MRSSIPLLFVAVLSFAVPAAAQTLTVEIEAELEGSADPSPAPVGRSPAAPADARPSTAPVVESPARTPDGATPVVVVVPPPEHDPIEERPAAPDPRPRVVAPPAPTVSSHEDVSPRAGGPRAPDDRASDDRGSDDRGSDDPDLEGWGGVGIWADALDLRGLDLTFDDPEIAALDGVRLSPGWAGNAPLAAHVAGGARLDLGMRAEGILRGPELRLYVGGGQTDGPFHALPGDPDGLSMAVRSSFLVRLETAMGLQVELGPVVPYVLAKASVGGIVLDVAVRDDRLGELGTESVDAPLLELGVEAGVGLRPLPGVEVDLAFRGSFVGTPSYGGVVSFVFHAEE
ncbi:MAG TPA: hypothetical protein RMH99_04520 [Sandaracinaceae bacterium LLY-WYZ-13_1]|nr:hypothetical protein [Sandaracinaceae bacterium LLY-WYZ-13_1]